MKQEGFTLVELMVSMLIGLFVLLGVSRVFLASKQSYQLNTGVARLQENGRFALELIGREIRNAGYRSLPLSQPVVSAVFGTNDLNGIANKMDGTDELVLRQHAQSLARGITRDCLGHTVEPDKLYTVILRINRKRSLECESQGMRQPLVDGINDLQLLFGELNTDLSTAPPKQLFRYLTADKITDWNKVISIRLDLTADSIESVDTSLPEEGRLEKTFSSTFAIRNRL